MRLDPRVTTKVVSVFVGSQPERASQTRLDPNRCQQCRISASLPALGVATTSFVIGQPPH